MKSDLYKKIANLEVHGYCHKELLKNHLIKELDLYLDNCEKVNFIEVGSLIVVGALKDSSTTSKSWCTKEKPMTLCKTTVQKEQIRHTIIIDTTAIRIAGAKFEKKTVEKWRDNYTLNFFEVKHEKDIINVTYMDDVKRFNLRRTLICEVPRRKKTS